MRYQNGLIGIITIVLAAVTALGTVYADQFPQASHAQSIGFDALAHDLFDDVLDGGDQADQK